MCKKTILLTVFVFVLIFFGTTPVANGQYMEGDIDGNGVIEMLDLSIFATQFLASDATSGIQPERMLFDGESQAASSKRV